MEGTKAQANELFEGDRLGTTPRVSMASQTTPKSRATPYAKLRQIAGLIRKPSTPRRRASSLSAPGSQSKLATNTPIRQPRTDPRTRTALQEISLNRSNPSTHQTLRSLKRKGVTPTYERRKSMKMQRETPRDALRNLSKILAQTNEPTRPSPLSAQAPLMQILTEGAEDLDDELSLEQPTVTFVVDENWNEDDSSLLAPPRLSELAQDDNHTAQSIEVARRATLNLDNARSSRGSFGPLHQTDETETPETPEKAKDSGGGRTAVGLGKDDMDIGKDVPLEPESQIFDISKDNPGTGGDKTLGEGGDLHVQSNLSGMHDQSAMSPFILQIPDFDAEDIASMPIEDELSQQSVMPPAPESEELQGPTPNLSLPETNKHRSSVRKAKAPKITKTSRYGKPYPSLPTGLTRAVVSTLARSIGQKAARLDKDAVNAVIEASDSFFEQLGGDLRAVSNHAGRKTIDESDMLAVMRRQRRISLSSTPFYLAVKHLPAELQREIPNPRPRPTPKRTHLASKRSTDPG